MSSKIASACMRKIPESTQGNVPSCIYRWLENEFPDVFWFLVRLALKDRDPAPIGSPLPPPPRIGDINNRRNSQNEKEECYHLPAALDGHVLADRAVIQI
ncbi:uncharacterized protein ARMOST_02024 [Armillaria ostoyae]|uniref:Uncharacterized protein n=1 Tax=Armillaria ostoyae TaxID=47428 RepID=A0A284QQM1_ARMOS|nr:uncharacterized protein ARMOST_02024 [Armillaria ostoyae]